MNERDNRRETALHSAAKLGYDEAVAFLLDQPGVDANVRDNDG